jgi:hypothetical protein
MKKLLKFIFLVIASWVILIWVYYQYNINKEYSFDDYKTDAIMVIGNKNQSLQIAGQLMQNNFSPLIFLIHNYSKEELHNFFTNYDIALEQVISIKEITDQASLFKQINEFSLENNLHIIRIVTENIYVPRINLKLKEASKKAHFTYILQPVKANHDYKSQLKEYFKYSLSLLATILGKGDEVNLSYIK